MQAPAPFSPETFREIIENPWPGNVRELRNHVRRLCILGSLDNSKVVDSIEKQPALEQDGHLPLKEFMDKTEKTYIIGVLQKNKGRVAPAYEQMGISRKGFYDKINKFGIDLNAFRKTA
jgi:two-component system C4-dicarboxylate transport response regulator DctD